MNKHKLYRYAFLISLSVLVLALSFVAPPLMRNVAQATAPNPAWWTDNNGYFSQYDDYYYKNGHYWQGQYFSGTGTVDSYLLSANATYDGVSAVGPRWGDQGVGDVYVYFTTDANASQEDEWQCTELSKRFLYLEYGVKSLSQTWGYNTVDKYSTTYPTQFYRVPNDGSAQLYPKPGDVISYGTSSPGHTAVVQSVGGEGGGNATVTLLEQNASGTGLTYQNFQNWQFQNGIDNDPNNTNTVTGWLTPLKWNDVSPSGTTPDSIYGMAASNGNNAWAAGYERVPGYNMKPVTYFNNGSGWTKYYPNNPNSNNHSLLYSIAGSSSDAWTVGEEDAGPTKTLAYHWTGSSWGNRVTSDNPGGTTISGHNNMLYSVAYAGTDVFAVGYYYNGSHNLPLIEKWTGTKFATQSASLPGSATDVTLKSVAFSSATDGWAVGSAWWYVGSTRNAYDVYYHYNGTNWTPTLGSASQGTLYGVTTVSGSEAWATGTQRSGSNTTPLITHYTSANGWQEDTSFNGHYPTTTYPLSIGSDSPSDVWIVGYSNGQSNTYTMHYNGSAWAQVTSPGSQVLQGVAVNSGTAWAGGWYGSGPSPQIFKSL